MVVISHQTEPDKLLVCDRVIKLHHDQYRYMTQDEFEKCQSYRTHILTLVKFHSKLFARYFVKKHAIEHSCLVRI